MAAPDKTATPRSLASQQITVALVGNPNTGKSSLFSSLCGIPARVGNYPGVTVEKKIGRYHDPEGDVIVVDLPGTYSLSARTRDEMVSVDVLLGRQADVPKLDAVVVIVDATNLERNLYLFTQLRELNIPLILVLNMWDRVVAGSVKIDLARLRERLGVQVLTATASRSIGTSEIKAAIRSVTSEKSSAAFHRDFFPTEFDQECDQLKLWLAEQGEPNMQRFLVERLLLDVDGVHAQTLSKQDALKQLPERIAAARERLAASGHRVPVVETKSRYNWIRTQLSGIVDKPDNQVKTTSDRIDHVLTHRVWGLVVFAAIMFAIFQSIYHGATGMMEGIETIQGSLTEAVQALIAPGTLRSLINDGVIAGVGSVLIFLPQILLLFFFIGLLEDCGYMARAAFVMDKLMTKLGLSGKSFLPLMSSFACAVPGIMATRVIENTRDRMVTILVAPLMSCSARLPVYILLIYTFVPEIAWLNGWVGLRGIVLFAMHVIGVVVAVPVAWLLKKFFFPGEASAFVMELPSYKLPSPKVVVYRVWERGQAFVVRAGTLIFCTAVLVWAAGYFPGDHSRLNEITRTIEALEAAPENRADVANSDIAANVASVESMESEATELASLEQEARQLSGQLIEYSYLGRAGKFIEPIVKPLGWDWRIGVGVIASFPAREVIIATLGTIYSLGGDVDEHDGSLKAALANSKWPDGRPVYTLPVALSIMVFFALCAQCAATLMVIRRETNSWRWPIFTFVYMTVLAYIGSYLTYNIASWLWG